MNFESETLRMMPRVRVCRIPFVRALWLLGGVAWAIPAMHAQLAFPQRAVEWSVGPQDRVLTAKFPFRNAGKEPIVIVALETSCGCVKATSARLDFAAGESGEIAVEYTPGLAGGAQHQSVTVMTSETPTVRHVLELRATVATREATASPLAAAIVPAQLIWVRAPLAAKRVTIDLVAAQAESAEVSAEPAAAFELAITPPDAAKRMVVAVTPYVSAEVTTGALIVKFKSASGAVTEQRVPLRAPAAK